MKYLDDSLSREVLFFTGKGGVGKSTLAWATAMACARAGKRVRVVGWNPLDKHPNLPQIQWNSLNVSDCFREYVTRVLKFETLYSVIFENHVLQTFVRATPGLAETVIAGKIWDLWFRKEQDILIVDLPSSGHALSFFQSPLGVSKVFAKGFVHEESEKIIRLFTSNATRLDLVALPQELPVREAGELHKKLRGAMPGLNFGFLHLNQVEPERNLPHSLPPVSGEIERCVRAYHAARSQEKESREELRGLEMPVLPIPRVPAETMAENREAVARHLESFP